MIKIPVNLVRSYDKYYAIWDKDVSIKFDTKALRTGEIMNISDKEDAAAVLEIYSPKGQRYDDIALLLGIRNKPIKLIGIGFRLENKDKTQNIKQFTEPMEAAIVIDSKYANKENLELYYYNIPSNKLEKVNFTKKSGEAVINAKITNPGEYVIISR